MEWLFFSYILLFPHSLRLRTLGNRVWTKIYTQIFFGRGGRSMCKVRVKEKKWKREMKQEKGVEMDPVACDFTRKCSQLLSYMGYLWTSLMQPRYLGAMVWVEEWVFLLLFPLSFIGQVHLRVMNSPHWLYHTGLPHSRWRSQSLTAPSGQRLGSGSLLISWGLLDLQWSGP